MKDERMLAPQFYGEEPELQLRQGAEAEPQVCSAAWGGKPLSTSAVWGGRKATKRKKSSSSTTEMSTLDVWGNSTTH